MSSQYISSDEWLHETWQEDSVGTKNMGTTGHPLSMLPKGYRAHVQGTREQ